MVGAMTLGVGDVAMVPATLSRKGKAMKDGIFVTFWYDGDGNYVATYAGDVSNPRR